MYYSFTVASILVLVIILILFVFSAHSEIKTLAIAKDNVKSSKSFKFTQTNNHNNSASPPSSPSTLRPHNILTIGNTTKTVSFVGEVNTTELTRPQFTPFVDTSSNESYLTKDFADFKIAKNQSELVRPNTKVFEIHLPSSINSSSSSFHNTESGFGRQGKIVHSTTFNHQENSIVINDKGHYHDATPAKVIAQNNQSGSLAGFAGLTQNCCNPPDVQIAAGPHYVLEMVNLDGAIYTKNGTLVKAFGLQQLFNPSDNSFSKSNSDDLTDPSLLFDNSSGRWFASISDTSTQSVRVAVSKTNDPSGIWRVYNFPILSSQPNNCSDQPFIGVSNDKFVFAVDNWANNCNWYSDNRPPEFRGAQYTIADKLDLFNGLNSVRSMQSRPDLNYFSLHPVSSLSPKLDEIIIVSVGNFNYNKIQLFYINGLPSNLHIKATTSDLIQVTHVPPDGIQPAAATITTSADRRQCCNDGSRTEGTIKEPRVSTGDASIQSAMWYQGKLWVVFNDSCFPNGDVKSRSCIRFVQLDTNTNNNDNKVIQDFDVGALGSSLYYPALSIDRTGNLGIIFGYSSQSIYPSLLVSTRFAHDILNTIEQPQVLKLGSNNELSNRYGDYFGASSDPSKDSTIIWIAGQYHAVKTWSTYIGSLDIH